MAAKIRQNDEVIVLTGKSKGKRGKVTKVLSNGKVIVEGVNIITKHQMLQFLTRKQTKLTE